MMIKMKTDFITFEKGMRKYLEREEKCLYRIKKVKKEKIYVWRIRESFTYTDVLLMLILLSPP